MILSAVNFDDGIEVTHLAELAQSADFRQHLRKGFMAAESRVDGHDENDVAAMENVFDQLDRACRIEDHAGLLAEVANLRKDSVQMYRRGRLRMHEETVGARFGEVGEISLQRNDHEVHIERISRAAPCRFDDRRPDRGVRHEAIIHHVDMNPVCRRRIDGANLLGEASEIS